MPLFPTFFTFQKCFATLDVAARLWIFPVMDLNNDLGIMLKTNKAMKKMLRLSIGLELAIMLLCIICTSMLQEA